MPLKLKVCLADLRGGCNFGANKCLLVRPSLLQQAIDLRARVHVGTVRFQNEISLLCQRAQENRRERARLGHLRDFDCVHVELVGKSDVHLRTRVDGGGAMLQRGDGLPQTVDAGGGLRDRGRLLFIPSYRYS